jgi:hypothetical protein
MKIGDKYTLRKQIIRRQKPYNIDNRIKEKKINSLRF